MATKFGSRCADMVDDRLPDLRTVMGTVYARAVPAGGDHPAHEVRIVGGFGRHRHHDAGLGPCRVAAEDYRLLRGNGPGSCQLCLRRGIGAPFLACKHCQACQDRVDCRQHASLAAAER